MIFAEENKEANCLECKVFSMNSAEPVGTFWGADCLEFIFRPIYIICSCTRSENFPSVNLVLTKNFCLAENVLILCPSTILQKAMIFLHIIINMVNKYQFHGKTLNVYYIKS